MGLVPKPSLLTLKKSRNKSAALAETNGTLISTMPVTGIQSEEPVITSEKREGMATLKHAAERMQLVPQHNLFNSLPLKYTSTLRTSHEGTKSFFPNSLYDKFKQLNKDLVGEYRKEQWIPMTGTIRRTSFSDLCKAGKLSVNFNRNYAACIPKLSRRSHRNTQADLCGQDVRDIPGLLCIGVENATYSETGFDLGEETSDPLVSQELHWRSLSSGSEIISSSTDAPCIQNAEDLSFMIYKSEQHSPVSVLEPLFEDASPEPANATTQPAKQPLRPHRFSFEDRSPVKHLTFHSDTITKTSISSKNHTSIELEYITKVLELSDLNCYQFALNQHYSTPTQILDQATYNKMKSHSTSQSLTQLEARLLFDHVNEVLQDTYHYHTYCGFYQWSPHLLTERNFFDQVVKIIETNLVQVQHHQVPEQKLVIDSMEKFGTWMDVRRELEDMVLEIADEVAEEVVEELLFEMWLD